MILIVSALLILLVAFILRMTFTMEILKMRVEALDVVAVVAWRELHRKHTRSILKATREHLEAPK